GRGPQFASAVAAGLQFTSAVDAAEALYIGYLGQACDLAGVSSLGGQLITAPLDLQAEDVAVTGQAGVHVQYPFLSIPQGATTEKLDSFINTAYQNDFQRAPTSTELTSAETALAANLGNAQFVDTFILNLMLGAQGQDLATVQNLLGSAENSLIMQQDYFGI